MRAGHHAAANGEPDLTKAVEQSATVEGEISKPKAPRRRRGIKRVEELLAAAEQVFAEVGYGAASMNAIAQRAGAPIGSLYQFFPNKTALGGALVERYAVDLIETWRTACAPVARGDWSTFADVLLDATLDCIDRHAAFGTLDEAQVQFQLRPTSHGEFEAELVALLGANAGGLPASDVRVVAIVALQMLKAAYALERGGAGPDIKNEMALVMRSYFQSKLGDRG